MRIAVIGVGSIGGLLAAKLARAGEEVSVVARGAHLAAIRENGLRLIEADGEFVARPAASDRIADLGPQDCVVIGVKAHQVADIAGDIPALLGPQTTILTAQNGIPWWYFHKSGGPYEGRGLDERGPGRAHRRDAPYRPHPRQRRLSRRRDRRARRHPPHREQPLHARRTRRDNHTARDRAVGGLPARGLQGARRLRHPNRDLVEAVGQCDAEPRQRIDPRHAGRHPRLRAHAGADRGDDGGGEGGRRGAWDQVPDLHRQAHRRRARRSARTRPRCCRTSRPAVRRRSRRWSARSSRWAASPASNARAWRRPMRW